MSGELVQNPLLDHLIVGDDDYFSMRILENYVTERHERQLAFEFKPTIRSYSETIRQVNLYKQFYASAKFYVVTYSYIIRFLDIFKAQDIERVQLESNADSASKKDDE